MSQATAVPYECTTCPAECVPTQLPGAPGADGAAGASGANGANAYTILLAGFTMPAAGGTEVIEVSDTEWMVPEESGVAGQALAIQFAGTLLITSIVDSTHVEVRNDGYTGNAPAGTLIPIGAKVGVSGIAGVAGAGAGSSLLIANNLSDVGSAVTSRSNLGLGSAATRVAGVANGQAPFVDDAAGLTAGEAVFATATGLESVTATQARANIQAEEANTILAALSAIGPGVADRIAYLTAPAVWALATLTASMRALLASASNAALLASLKVLPRSGLLGSLIGADMNITTDQAIAMSSANYRVTGILVTNASLNLTTAQGGVYNAAGKPGGGTLVGAGQVYTALTAANKFVDLTLSGVALTDVQTAGFLQFSLTVAQGAAATADVYVFGVDLS